MMMVLPAAKIFPAIQKVARALIIAPLLKRGWNSEKYEKMTGMEPPTLRGRHRCIHVILVKWVMTLSVWFLSKPSECLGVCKNSFGMTLPDSTEEPQEQKEPEPRGQTGHRPKCAIHCQRDDQNAPPSSAISQIAPNITAHHHPCRRKQPFDTVYLTEQHESNHVVMSAVLITGSVMYFL